MATNFGFEANEDTQRTSDPITNESFFPSLNLVEFTKQWPIPSTMDNELLIAKLMAAMDEVSQKLSAFKAEQLALGFTKLSELVANEYNGIHAKVYQYKRAVYALAKSELILSSLSLSRKADAESMAHNLAESANEYKRISTNALARITGHGALGVHLI